MTALGESVQEVLDARLRRDGRQELRRSFAVAATLHLTATVLLVVVPMLSAQPRQPARFVAIQVVPAVALGRPDAKPAVTSSAPVAKATAPPPAEPVKAPTAPSIAKPVPTAAVRPPAAQQPAAGGDAAPAPKPAVPSSATPDAPVQGSPQGVAGGVALGAAVAGLDNPSFTYGYYLDQMLAQIQREWVRPPLGSGVEALVSFRIQRDGRVTELRIERSSGYSSFDLAGLRAIQAAAPLPPLPRGYSHPSLGVNLILK